jgi:hypothetical protein
LEPLIEEIAEEVSRFMRETGMSFKPVLKFVLSNRIRIYILQLEAAWLETAMKEMKKKHDEADQPN